MGNRHPPESHLAAYRITHLCRLYGNTGITLCLALNTNGVTRLVRLLVFRELYLEGGTLVLFHPDAAAAIVGTKGKPSVQQSCRQREGGCALAEAVSRN